MPILSRDGLAIDHTDDGQGPPVVLVHSSVSGNRQWRALVEALKDRHRVLAVNLYGYGETPPWPDERKQTLRDQAALVAALCEGIEGPVSIVGHSFGGSVALKAAQVLGARVGRLVLLEPNPFHLLAQEGRAEALAEIGVLGHRIRTHGAAGDWPGLSPHFADYWLGDGAWAAMPEKRRAAFIASIPPLYREYDAVMAEDTRAADWGALPARTLVMSDPATRRPILEIVDIFRKACPRWSFEDVAEGGHMAPLTHPHAVNPAIRRFLDPGVA